MKMEDLALVTSEQFGALFTCWPGAEELCARFRRVAAMQAEWNALDVLDLEDMSVRDKFWLVLRPQFLPPMLLHEFACRCAEWALSLVENPDNRSVEAIRVKRRWMTGDATDDELRAARRAAWSAAEVGSSDVWPAAAAADAAADAADAAADAWWGAAWLTAVHAESAAAWLVEADARWAASFATADDDAWEHEIEILLNLINEWE